MNEESYNSEGLNNSNDLGCLANFALTFVGGVASVAVLAGVLRLGPIDYARTLYNQMIGDTPALKEKLLDYVRDGISVQYPRASAHDVQQMVAKELGYKLDHLPESAGRIDPNMASIEALFDASEKHARSSYQQFVWPSLE
ncbi:MAG TPA: hypothetical protein VJB66_01135 [Candidatus Nanoarchaeia archaeon]|nr:hypothetical protein [Candidatus Nanoarchaeia archaeon]